MLGKIIFTPVSLSILFFAQFTLAGSDPELQSAGQAALTKIFNEVTVEQPMCFGREYSSVYLTLNPLKTVKRIFAKFATEPEYNTKSLQIELSLKGEQHVNKLFKAFMICSPASGSCNVECDGGRVYFKGATDDKVQLLNQGFIAQGDCGEELETIFIEAKKGGDDVFNLKRLPAEFCQQSN